MTYVKLLLVYQSGHKLRTCSTLPTEPTIVMPGNRRFTYRFALIEKDEVKCLVFKEWEEEIDCHLRPVS